MKRLRRNSAAVRELVIWIAAVVTYIVIMWAMWEGLVALFGWWAR